MANVDVTRIASNVGALNSLNSLQNINAKLAMHQTRLSTGKRINSAADDPAGLTIATKMLARSEGLKVSLDNIGDAKNMLSVAESGMSKMTDIITQMRGKAEQAASDTLGSSERAAIQTQLSAYSQQLQDIVDQTKWNGVKLLDNSTGNKVFQTGADEGEVTNWSLPGALDPTSMGLSKKVSQAQTTVNNTAADFVTVASKTVDPSGTLGNMTELTTGGYAFAVLDKSSTATQGKTTLDSGSTLVGGVSGMTGSATAASANAMTSGKYSIKINAATDATHTDYTITNLSDSSWNGTGSMAVSGADISGGDLVDAAGGATVGVNFGFVGTPSTLVAGQSMTMEYIKGGDVKVALNDASGQAVQTAQNATGSLSGSYAYTAAGSTYQSGRGVSMKLAAFASVSTTTGNQVNFTFEKANNYSVNVSNATLAGQYMSTANSAMDKVTSAMSDLGSLMARLSFKEEAVSTAQVNVEAGYSRIMNANMAEEQMNASKYTIQQQIAVSMLAQANQAPQSLLSLFR
jgi:flagellin